MKKKKNLLQKNKKFQENSHINGVMVKNIRETLEEMVDNCVEFFTTLENITYISNIRTTRIFSMQLINIWTMVLEEVIRNFAGFLITLDENANISYIRTTRNFYLYS